MFWSVQCMRKLLNLVHCQLLLLRRYLQRGGVYQPSSAVVNSKMPQGSFIYDFFCRLPENPYTLHLKIVGITSFPKRNITKKINFCNCHQMMWQIKTSGGLILMGNLVPYLFPLQNRNSFAIAEIILSPWVRRELLKSNIKMNLLFRFIMTRSVFTSFMLIFFIDR